MDALAYWGLCPTFSIVQAAFLFCGRDPSNIDRHAELQPKLRPDGYVPVTTSLVNAVEAGLLSAEVRYEYYEDGPSHIIDIHETKIARKDLDEFFDARSVLGHFFGRRFNSAFGSGDAAGARGMPLKLNAALKAWTAVSSDPVLLRGKSPKQALKAWLVQHADELRLRRRDGELNAAGIEEICKVANWKPEGGATPTPAPLPAPAAAQVEDFSTHAADLDNEIPF